MAQDNEQLRISAELDTSKLKQQARSGFRDVKDQINELNDVAKRLSREMDNIGKDTEKVMKSLADSTREANNEMGGLLHNIEQINNRGMLRALGTGAKLLTPVAKEAMGALGIPEEAGDAVGSIVQGGFAGARAGAAFGPMGAAVGALVGAGSSLLKAGYQLQKAAADQAKAAQDRGQKALDNYKNYQENQRISSILESGDRGAMLDELYSQQRLLKQRKAAMEFRAAMVENGITDVSQAESTLREKGFWKKSWDILTTQAGGDAGVATGHAENLMTMAESLDDIINKTGESARIIQALENALGKLTKQEQDYVKNKIKEIEKQKKAEEKALQQTQKAFEKRVAEEEKAQKKLEKAGVRSLIGDLKGSISDQSSLLGNIQNIGKNYKLTDALTRIGGTSGYSTQMNGVASKVKDIAKNISEILTFLKERLSIQESYAATF